MNAVSLVLLETIRELQALPALQGSSLVEGLALPYDNHRESVDIDLLFKGIISERMISTLK